MSMGNYTKTLAGLHGVRVGLLFMYYQYKFVREMDKAKDLCRAKNDGSRASQLRERW